ncbi:helix-turn-helix domain-containing protein [Metabacillus hrfriensis]|uniref:Helix-turn-helix domain-containing protein n=2 Tax=Metabacillus TaxID=2675233 RepID=A0ACD4REZ3_9BACI|nr:helix-turn-helix domain-containing protein [Metabacillus sp. CT-WN-B3]WHZ59013.1 helix-turn-helix domain-containing protein [Metabacillus sp. CT-WN-B3]
MEKKAETYDISFKKKAVDLYHQKKNYSAVSRELNIHRKNIQRWVKQFSEDGIVSLREKRGRKSMSSKVSSSTIESPQKKIKRLEAENELLKKLLKM